MRRSKRLFLMLGVLAVVCAATIAATRLEERREQIKTSGEIVLEVASEDVRSLTWEYGGTSLAFHREESWLYDADEAFPVDGEKIRGMLVQFEAFGASFTIEDVTDYSLYGLDEPVCTITFATEARSYTIELGDFSRMDQERYVSIGDGKVYLARHDPLEEFDAALRDMIQQDESLSYEQITQIKWEGAEAFTVFYEEDSAAGYRAEDVYFTKRDGQILPLDTDRVETYLEALTTLSPTDYVTYNATREELEAYALLTPELTVAVDYIDRDGAEQTYTLAVSRDPEQLSAAEEAQAKGEEPEAVTGYVRVGASQIVYRISASKCEKLLAASYDQLRRREVLPADFEDVDEIEISLEGARYTISADGEGKNGERSWTYREEGLEIDELQQALEGLRVESADKFTAEGSAGKEEIRLSVHLNQEQHPTVEIVLYRYDGKDCLAVVDGESFALIPRSDVVELIEAVNAIVLDQA